MFRSVTSNVSALSGFVANGHQTVQHVSSSPSKIPYVGFSPVRLQTGRQLPPSIQARQVKREVRMRCRSRSYRQPQCMTSREADKRDHVCPTSRTVSGRSANRHFARRHAHTSPEALCSPAGYVVPQSHRYYGLIRDSGFVPPAYLLRPGGSLPFDFTQAQTQSFPIFLRASVCPCHLPYPGGLCGCAWLFLHHTRWPSPDPYRLGIRTPTPVGSHVGRVTRLQSSVHPAARTVARPSPTRAFTPKLSPPRVAPAKRRV